jgi:hypothetical protein
VVDKRKSLYVYLEIVMTVKIGEKEYRKEDLDFNGNPYEDAVPVNEGDKWCSGSPPLNGRVYSRKILADAAKNIPDGMISLTPVLDDSYVDPDDLEDIRRLSLKDYYKEEPKFGRYSASKIKC